MRRRKGINSYSEKQLESLPESVATDVYLALKYTNAQIFGRVREPHCCPVRTSVQERTADKAIATTDRPEALERTESEGNCETELTTERVDVAVQATEASSLPHTEEKGEIHRIKEDWERKQQRFEAIATHREIEEKKRAEAAAKQAEEAQFLKLQTHKSTLLSRHLLYLEAKHKRKELIRAGNANYRKVRASLPLYEQLQGLDKVKQLLADEAYQQEITQRKMRMRSLDPSEFLQHEDSYEQTKAALLRCRKKHRQQRLHHIRTENQARVYYQSPLYELSEEERRHQLAQEELKERTAREALRKGKAYGQLVMEVYRPHTFLPKSSTGSPSKSSKSSGAYTAKTPDLPTNPTSGLFTTRRRYKVLRRPQPATPVPLPTTDYNTERRHYLSNSLLTNHSSPIFHYQSHDFDFSADPETLRKEANRLSIEAQRGDIQVRRLDHTPKLQSEACGRVAAMYLDSIKARLELVRRTES